MVGASSGGIDAIRSVLSGLPEAFPASIFIVLHTAPDAPGVLDGIFDRAGPLPALLARNDQKIEPGRIYVARPDHHLIIEPGRMCLTRGPRVVGVILSGGLDDGTSGLWAIKRLGGTAVVQDPHDARAPSMPQSAMNHVEIDYVLPVAEIAPLLVRLAATPADEQEGPRPVPEEVKIEVDIAREDKAKEAGVFDLGDASKYACPECHGVLLQMRDATPIRFRCHTGHAYTLESLLTEMDDAIEDSLRNAIAKATKAIRPTSNAARRKRRNARTSCGKQS